MSMAISRLQELQDCFPQLSRGTVESMLDQVGSERAVDALLEMTSESGDCASHKVDIHPSQLMGALLPTEDSRPYPASLDAVAVGNNSGSSSSYLKYAPSKPSKRPSSPVPLQRRTPSQPPLPPRYPQSPKHMQPIAGQNAWWPAWQGGRPVAKPSPPQLAPVDMSADDTPLEELLQNLNSGSDDSDSEAFVPGAVQGCKQEVMQQASPKLRPYDPAAVGSAAASPRPSSILRFSSPEESDDVSLKQLFLDMVGGEASNVNVKGNDQTQSQVQKSNTTELDDHQSDGYSTNSDNLVLGMVLAPVPVHRHIGGAAVDALGLQHVELQRLAPQAGASAGSGSGAVSPDDLIAGSAGDSVVASTVDWSPGEPWPKATASPPGKRRPPSAADFMYSLSGSSGGKRGCTMLKADRGCARSRSRGSTSGSAASREASAAKSETSSQSSGGVWDNKEDALTFLTTCFPGHPLVGDILAGCGGDANAATAKLLELKDEEQAHAVAQAMHEAQELSTAPAKVEMDEEQKLARLALEFPELSAQECSAALAAQNGNLLAAVAILDMHVSAAKAKADQADAEVARRVAAEEQRAHERAVADQQAADWALAMGLQDVAEKDTKPSPAASPEDLAAIAALEAGGDVVLQPPRTPTPPSHATHHQAASPYLQTGRAPRPPLPLRSPLATYTPRQDGQSGKDSLWKDLRGPAEALWQQRRETMDAAATAYRKGRTAQGKTLLARAEALRELAGQQESHASQGIFRAKNMDPSMPMERIDLHGQKVAEARDMLMDVLGPCIKYKHKPAVEIITGRGLHSENGEARIRPMVKQYLQEQGLQFVERPGSYIVLFQA